MRYGYGFRVTSKFGAIQLKLYIDGKKRGSVAAYSFTHFPSRHCEFKMSMGISPHVNSSPPPSSFICIIDGAIPESQQLTANGVGPTRRKRVSSEPVKATDVTLLNNLWPRKSRQCPSSPTHNIFYDAVCPLPRIGTLPSLVVQHRERITHVPLLSQEINVGKSCFIFNAAISRVSVSDRAIYVHKLPLLDPGQVCFQFTPSWRSRNQGRSGPSKTTTCYWRVPIEAMTSRIWERQRR